MNVSHRWLKALAPTIDGSASDLAKRLTYTAVPVDEVVWLGAGLEDIVVGRVESVSKHPNANRLVICQVDIGGDAPVQVVTGAPKVVEGGFYPFVGAGSSLLGGQLIKRAKLRDVYSEGMLCSERELGLGRDQEGIMLLHGEFTPGMPLIDALDLDDHRLVVDITANRPDLLGHWGVARELAKGGNADLRLPPFPDQRSADYKIKRGSEEAKAAGVSVRIEDPEGCPRYMGAVVRNVQVGPSPVWLANRLRAVGLQPINNVVDSTNYVLYEMNQPLHAFDLARLRGPAVVIRRAKKGERLRTLDGKERVLDADKLVIADAEEACALAGVIGGAGSEVTERTTDVFIECAYFDPKRVRHAARSFGLDTDASFRFRRGTDPTGLPAALRRVVELILSVAGGDIAGPVLDVNPQPPRERSTALRLERVRHLLGVDLDESTIRAALEPVGFALAPSEAGAFSVEIPSWRPDVEREVDVIEEIARRHGYGNFPDEIGTFRPTEVPEDGFTEIFNRLTDFFVTLGFLESKTAPFAPEEAGEVRLMNPLSEREAHLRADLLAELLRRTEYNFARGQRDVRLFELGTVFTSSGGPAPLETIRVAAVWTGCRSPAHWSDQSEGDWDVWDLKWIMGSAARLATPAADVRSLDSSSQTGNGRLDHVLVAMAPDGGSLGWAGRVRAGSVEAPPWAGPVWGLEVDVTLTVSEPPIYRPLPVYPAVERDLALLVPRKILAAEVEGVIREVSPDYLEALTIFDVYEGNRIPDDARSVAWRLRFRSAEGTLTDEEVDSAIGQITAELEERLNVGIRGS